MYALVKFYDNIHYVCKSNTITVKKDIIKALYKNGRKYPANVLARNDNETTLKKIMQNINNEKPYIICEKIYLGNKKKINKSLENDVQTNAQISLDINTKVGLVEENTHAETVAQNCEAFENEDTLIQLDINTKVGSVDENTHAETAAQNEGRESFENEDTRKQLDEFL